MRLQVWGEWKKAFQLKKKKKKEKFLEFPTENIGDKESTHGCKS